MLETQEEKLDLKNIDLDVIQLEATGKIIKGDGLLRLSDLSEAK